MWLLSDILLCDFIYLCSLLLLLKNFCNIFSFLFQIGDNFEAVFVDHLTASTKRHDVKITIVRNEI